MLVTVTSKRGEYHMLNCNSSLFHRKKHSATTDKSVFYSLHFLFYDSCLLPLDGTTTLRLPSTSAATSLIQTEILSTWPYPLHTLLFSPLIQAVSITNLAISATRASTLSSGSEPHLSSSVITQSTKTNTADKRSLYGAARH